MVSTYLSYISIVQNYSQAMTRVAQQPDVTRDAAYYKANIGNVRTVDDLLKNDRLYQYAMKAYGLGDMIYAKAFMRQVLQSDLSDPSSFANRMVDKRYQAFAAAFSFSSGETPVAQSQNQTDDMIGLYTASMQNQADAVGQDTAYYNATIGGVQSADQLLNDDRLRNYVFSAFGIDGNYTSLDTIKQVLSSDPSDPNSYVNTAFVSRLPGLNNDLAQAQSDAADASSNIAAYTDQLSQPGADTSTLTANIAIENARLQSANDNISSLNDAIATIGNFADLAGAFEFSPDGSLPPGVSAQTDANRIDTNQRFANSKIPDTLAADPLDENFATTLFKAGITTVDSVQAFVSTPSVYDFALQAVGLDPQQVSPDTIKAVLESDLSDPTSYVYTLKDDRYVQLARAFNFDGNGNLTTPLVAQDTPEATQIAKDYVVAKIKFVDASQQADIRAQAEQDTTYYAQTLPNIKSVSDLLADNKMVNVILVANGLDPTNVSTDFLNKIFSSDLNDPKSFANTQSDPRYAEIVASFNFDKNGNVARIPVLGPQKRDQLLETQNNYVEQALEQQQGDANQGVRLALYFRQKAGTITSAYDILADKALSEVFRTTFDLPDAMATMDIDQQAKVVESHINLKDLADPAKVDKLLSRFSAMYDMQNGPQDYSSPLLSLFSGAGSSMSGAAIGVSDSTMMAIAKLGQH